ncbi:hypothetical protein U1Q18_039686 [Sarracenia purpurea var. burkii]
MQCANAYWASTARLPFVGASNPPAKLSVSQTRTQFLTRRNGVDDDGDEREGSAAALPLPPHVTSIASSSNPFVKHCVKLRLSSSYRHSYGSVLVVGTTPIRYDALSCPVPHLNSALSSLFSVWIFCAEPPIELEIATAWKLDKNECTQSGDGAGDEGGGGSE